MSRINLKAVVTGIAASLVLAIAPGTAMAKDNGNDNEHVKITICHATGSQTNPYVQISPNANGVVSGHYDHQDARDIIPQFDYNDHGTTKHFPGQNLSNGGQAILDNDCVVEGGQGGGGTDVCVNIQGVQTEVPSGMVRDEQGNCTTPGGGNETDVCVNIQGVQTEVPSGMVRDEQGNCTTPGGGQGGGGTTTTTTTSTPQVLGTSTTVAASGLGGGPQIAAIPQGSVNGGLGAASETVNHVSLMGLVGALLSLGSGLVMLNRRQS